MNIDEFLTSIKQKPEKRHKGRGSGGGREPESVFGQAMSRKRPVPPAFINNELPAPPPVKTQPPPHGATAAGAGGGGIIKKSNLSSKGAPPSTAAAAVALKEEVDAKVQPATPGAAGLNSMEISDEERLRILQMVENEPESETPPLDDAALKRMISLLEKRIAKNQEMRIKFTEQPEKFMESEVELHESIQELHALATISDLYPLAVNLNLTSILISLLPHENSDISCAVLDLLQEITDIDTLNENEDATGVFVDSLLDHQGLALLVQNLDRLDEGARDEFDGIHNTLAIFENLFEIRSELCGMAKESGLLSWLLKRLKSRSPFDGNKLYAAEMLAILLQDTPENRVALGEMDGIDVLLQQLAVYKRNDPASGDESEYMENLFNCLCSALLFGGNREKFLKGEGPQLMNLMLREKKQSRSGSLKVLNHAVSGPDGTSNANKIIEILGLRTLFPLLMKTPKKHKRKGLSVREHEEHVVSILAALLLHTTGPTRTRILSKFEENDFEKVERLAELHFKYLEKVNRVDQSILKSSTGGPGPELDEDEIYLKRLDNGLFTLQLVDYIIMEISCASTKVKERLGRIIGLRGGTLDTIREIVAEYERNLGDEDVGWKERQADNISFLMERF